MKGAGCHCGRACCTAALATSALQSILILMARSRSLSADETSIREARSGLATERRVEAMLLSTTLLPTTQVENQSNRKLMHPPFREAEALPELGLTKEGKALAAKAAATTARPTSQAPLTPEAARAAVLSDKQEDDRLLVPTTKAPLQEVIHMFSKKMPFRFHSCALIGSSSLMLGLGLGKQIERHDTIIRVNRLPNASMQPDFGSRTDVLFVNRFTLSAEMKVDILGGGSLSCTESPRKCKKLIGALIFKGSGPSRPWGKYTRYMRAFPFPIGHQLNENARIAIRMPVFQMGKGHVTSGFMGFLAFAPLCSTITLYGFGGSSSADGHSEKKHYLKGEHELLRRAASGNLKARDMHVPGEELHNDSRWLLGHMRRMNQRIMIMDLALLQQKRALKSAAAA
mmetsp:Transcript_66840/g.159974  ORF Transcript_66840/g.159974 Transcript_66840/m.159974 type:complete len:400 (+) Transcript_66840:195-1394(+)